MLSSPIEIEGTWEQIASQAAQYAGNKMRLTVFPEPISNGPAAPQDARSLEEKLAAIVARIPDEEWANLPEDMGQNLDHYIYGTPRRR